MHELYTILFIKICLIVSWAKLGKTDIPPRIIVITNGKTATSHVQQGSQTQEGRDTVNYLTYLDKNNIRFKTLNIFKRN